jgi:hypothetical protein
MSRMQNIFSIYSVLMMLFIGVYMVWIQSINLKEIYEMDRESKFVKTAGYFYIVFAVASYIISFL